MGILDNFEKEKNVTCNRYTNVTTTNQTTGLKETVSTLDLTFTAFKYTKSEAQRYFNAQFNIDTTDVLILEPNYTINEEDTINVIENRGTYKYEVQTVQDVGNQGEVMLVGIKKVKKV
jgi:hypothetical protein